MKQTWFKKAGWLCLSLHSLGIVIILGMIVFTLAACIIILRNGHSASGGLYEVFVFPTCTAFWWEWVADKTSAS